MGEQEFDERLSRLRPLLGAARGSIEAKPGFNQRRKARTALSPSARAPRGTIFQPARQGRSSVRRARVNADEFEAVIVRSASDDLAVVSIGIEYSNLAWSQSFESLQSGRDDLLANQSCLLLDSIGTFVEVNGPALRRFRFVAAVLAKRSERCGNDLAAAAVIELETDRFGPFRLGEILQQFRHSAGESVNGLVLVTHSQKAHACFFAE